MALPIRSIFLCLISIIMSIGQLSALPLEEGRMNETDDISDDRRDNFFSRALRECQRMSGETVKSQSKVADLHAELGRENFTAWRNEHAAEVLLPHQAQSVAIASQENMDSYYAEHEDMQT